MIKAPLYVDNKTQQRLTLAGMFAHSVGVVSNETVEYLLQNENRAQIPELVAIVSRLGRDQRIFLETATKASSVKIPIPAELAQEWEKFWSDEYGIFVDFAQLPIPPAPLGYKARFIAMPEQASQSPEMLYRSDSKAYGGKVWKFTDKSLDEVVTVHKHVGTFGFWVADEREAPDGCIGGGLINLNTLAVDELGWTTETLPMRQVHGRKFFREQGIQLDETVITVTAGSRTADGYVPGVCLCGGGGVGVDCWALDGAGDGLRFRRASLL